MKNILLLLCLISSFFSYSSASQASLKSLVSEDDIAPIEFKNLSLMQEKCKEGINLDSCATLAMDQFLYGSKKVAYEVVNSGCKNGLLVICSIKITFLWSDRRLDEANELSSLLCHKNLRTSCELREDILSAMITREMSKLEPNKKGANQIYGRLVNAVRDSCSRGITKSCKKLNAYRSNSIRPI